MVFSSRNDAQLLVKELRSATGEKMREVMYYYMKNPEAPWMGRFVGILCHTIDGSEIPRSPVDIGKYLP